ncbi:LOW QUALITY PROTEIN: RxLR effector protein, partial [Phytophthora megakarya]
MLRTNSDNANNSEERMINSVLGKVGSVVEAGGAKVAKEAPKLEKYQQWLTAKLTPSQVRVGELKNEPWQKLHSILQGKDSDQYLKFFLSTTKDCSQEVLFQSLRQKSELWLYADLTPSLVRKDIFKKEPLDKILKSKDSNQYLKFLIDYERLQPGNTIPKSASSMELSELWLFAGLTPAQVRIDVLKNVPLHKNILQTHQYLKFLVDYERLQPGSTIPKSASNMELFELWLFAGLKPPQVRKDILKNIPLEKILPSKESHQYLKFLVDYKRLQPGSTIPKAASSMENFELWLYAGLTPSQVRIDIVKHMPWLNIFQGQESHQYLKFL